MRGLPLLAIDPGLRGYGRSRWSRLEGVSQGKPTAAAERLQRMQEVVDEFGVLYVKLGPAKKRADQLRQEILSWVAREPAEKEVRFAGQTHVVTVSARSNERSVQVKRLYKVIGLKRLLEICHVTLSKIEFLSREQQKQVVEERDCAGPRQVTATPRFEPEQAKLPAGKDEFE